MQGCLQRLPIRHRQLRQAAVPDLERPQRPPTHRWQLLLQRGQQGLLARVEQGLPQRLPIRHWRPQELLLWALQRQQGSCQRLPIRYLRLRRLLPLGRCQSPGPRSQSAMGQHFAGVARPRVQREGSQGARPPRPSPLPSWTKSRSCPQRRQLSTSSALLRSYLLALACREASTLPGMWPQQRGCRLLAWPSPPPLRRLPWRWT
mmetsp:Transcript_17948/g.50216  ORF Transcript_17948/g.50216 Transcript_17948/m.50216 type:complete len:204 (-) Transcript_17948:579-1190(-)